MHELHELNLTMSEIYFKEESYKIIGLCMEIHRTLGMGFKEATYKDALELEFQDNLIIYEREKKFSVEYKNRLLSSYYVADFVVYNGFILEIKATAAIIDPHLNQAISYLRAAELKLGIIVNFGAASLEYKRVVF